MYLPPERLNIESCKWYDIKADIWALGVTFYNILFNEAIYVDLLITQMMNITEIIYDYNVNNNNSILE